MTDVVLVIVVATALAFDFTNGFHDTANAVAWVLTLPASAAVGGLTYGVVALFGTGGAGPLVVSTLLLGALGAAFTSRLTTGRTLTAEG